jgi:glycosyltransferase involved in cell wall biosynthesis
MNHIALLIPTIDRIGGAERQLMLLASGLRRRGWRVSMIALSGTGGSSAGELLSGGVEFLSLAMRKGLADPRGWLRFNRWLHREQPHIVHAHLPHAAWMARWSRLAAPVRVVLDTIHTAATGTPGRRLGYRLSRWLPDCVTAVGEGVRNAYAAAEMVTASQCCVIPNGVDTEIWSPDAMTREAVRSETDSGEGFLWLAAGRLEPVKDYETMLRAFAQTPETGRLAIAGSGPLDSELKKLASALEITHRVRFLGFVPDVRRSMQAADAFVLASRVEGLPMGLIEAAACALPAVATDVPGTREVIIDGETGWLAPAGDAQLLSMRMTAMMQSSPQDRSAMGERARQRAIERYSLARVLDRWEALYSELLARNPHPKRWAGPKRWKGKD